MGILSWIFGSKDKAEAPDQSGILHIAPGRGFTFRLTGESHFQATLDSICGGKCEEGHRLPITAKLRFEDDNAHDADAIAVLIQDKTVGYVPASVAARLRASIERLNPDGRIVCCRAKIVGGWKRAGDDEGHYGVNLSLSDPLRVAKPQG